MRSCRLEPSGLEGATELTPREREVAALLASGSSNRAIADRLVISCWAWPVRQSVLRTMPAPHGLRTMPVLSAQAFNARRECRRRDAPQTNDAYAASTYAYGGRGRGRDGGRRTTAVTRQPAQGRADARRPNAA